MLETQFKDIMEKGYINILYIRKSSLGDKISYVQNL